MGDVTKLPNGDGDELDALLAEGSERPAEVTACVNEEAIDHAHLLAYRAGSLASELSVSVERHLIDCPYCRDLLAELAQAPRRRWPKLAISAAAAILVVGFAATQFLTSRGTTFGPYEMTMAEGWDATTRGEEPSVPNAKVFRVHSYVRLKLEPIGGGVAAPHLRIVRRDANGRITLVPSSVVRPGKDGVFVVRASGKNLFGEAPGKKTLYAVTGQSDGAFANVGGQSLQEAQAAAPGLKWLELFEADYIVSD